MLTLRTIVLGLIAWSLILPSSVHAAPYFTIEGSDIIWGRQVWYYYIKLHTDGQTLSAAHVTMTVDQSLYEAVSFSQANSVCDMWGPADPSVSTSSASTPYVQQNVAYFSCGFTGSGHKTASGDADGDLFLTMKVLPDRTILGPLERSFAFSNELFKYIGSSVTAGSSIDLDYKIATTSTEVQPTPTATPTPPPPDTLTADELQFLEIGVNNNTVSSTNQSGTIATSSGLASLLSGDALSALLDRDDTIPPPPEMTPRPPVTPYGLPNYAAATQSGDVLSVQSLRELLLPGTSEADSRVVLFNLITSIILVLVIALLLWRLYEARKTRTTQKRHLNELLVGEVSMIENKFGFRNDMNTDDFIKQLRQIRSDIEESDV